jgi:hypothetical protein
VLGLPVALLVARAWGLLDRIALWLVAFSLLPPSPSSRIPCSHGGWFHGLPPSAGGAVASGVVGPIIRRPIYFCGRFGLGSTGAGGEVSAGFLSGGGAAQIRKLVCFVLGRFVLESKVVYLRLFVCGISFFFGNSSSSIRVSVRKSHLLRTSGFLCCPF